MPQHNVNEVRVWDLPLRLFHWSLATSFLVCYLSEDDWMRLHIYVGYGMAGLLLFRLVWGLVGPEHSRFRDFVRSPAIILDYLKQMARRAAPRYLGHNPAGGAMAVALLLTLSLTVLSGLALYGSTDFAGPMAGWFRGEHTADLLEDLHEGLANFSLFLILLHLAGVLFSSLSHQENLVRAMVTGMKKEQCE
jgi:cytochrome b